ncbi:uncharacterized protein G2W53_033759 [Senna tora]|uniref:Uncharacterized protein n=1 Tax=Senna tora TaxID=362788 RepID=A0A834SY46_9FABA|nr:uncharacterized protein G2W53_033759 [Senna tora]
MKSSIKKKKESSEISSKSSTESTKIQTDEDLSNYSPISEDSPSSTGSSLECSCFKNYTEIQQLKHDFKSFKKATRRRHKEITYMLSRIYYKRLG